MIIDITVRMDLSKLATEVNSMIDNDNDKETPESLQRYIVQNPGTMRQLLEDGICERLT